MQFSFHHPNKFKLDYKQLDYACYVHNHKKSCDTFSEVFLNLMMSTCGLIVKGTSVRIVIFNSTMLDNY